jgi:hypothetical protein
MKKIIFVIPLMLLFFGCVGHINEVMNSWVNHHFSELIASWGPPAQVFDDGQGGRIFIYLTNRSWTVQGSATTTTTGNATIDNNYIWGSARSITTYNPPQNYGYTAYRMFWITSSGYVYKWAWKGL